MRKIVLLASLSSLLCLCVACNNENNQLIKNNEQEQKIQDGIEVEHVQRVFQTIPSPVEAALLLQRSGVLFNADLVLEKNQSKLFETVKEKALALGIYGADLSYTTVFEQSELSIDCFTTIKELADDLGVEHIINSNLLKRTENNVNRKDSLLIIIGDVYMEANEEFADQEAGHISALIMTGGWIEALYISTRLNYKQHHEKELMQRLAEQKMSLNNLIELINLFPNKSSCKQVKKDLMHIKASFDKIKVMNKRSSIISPSGIVRIKGKKTYNITENNFIEIKEKIKAIRNSYLNRG